jgi:hypothetical protein
VTILEKELNERERETRETKRKGRTIETIETIETTKTTSLLKQCSVSMRAEPLSLKCAHVITLKTTKECMYV